METFFFNSVIHCTKGFHHGISHMHILQMETFQAEILSLLEEAGSRGQQRDSQ
jgi:hypothetical protein